LKIVYKKPQQDVEVINVKGKILLYKNKIHFTILNKVKVNKLDGSYCIIDRELTYINDNQQLMGVKKEIILN